MNAVRWLVGALAAALLSVPSSAHIGNPNVYYEGEAGPHSVRVVVRPPTAIPGRAEATISVAGEGLEVGVLAVHEKAAGGEQPPATVAETVAGVAGMYSAEVWLLEAGAYALRVTVHGGSGHGEVVVPINAVNRAPAEITHATVAQLAVIALLLVVGAAVLARSAVGGLAAGTEAVSAEPAGGRIAGWIAGAVVALAVVAGYTAWARYDRAFRSDQLFAALPVAARAEPSNRSLVISRVPDERGRSTWPRLVTDHGKLMHAFLLHLPDLDAFAHIHPRPDGQGNFVVAVPPLPAGRYQLYADITEEGGLSQTLATQFDLPDTMVGPAPAAAVIADADDSWAPAESVSTAVPQDRAELASGYEMRWTNPGIAADPSVGSLSFEVVDAAGRPAHLLPYMGMLGHAAVRRDDAQVFAHLHPVGSISMASQEVLSRPASGQASDPHAGHDMHAMHGHHHQHVSNVSFPFEFPMTGTYRIWVQVKVAEGVLTGVFDREITVVR